MFPEEMALRPAQSETDAPLKLSVQRDALTLSGELSLAQWRAALSLLEPGR